MERQQTAQTTSAPHQRNPTPAVQPVPPQATSLPDFLEMQQTLGNQAVQRLYRTGVLQPKLKVGAPGDKYEQEADRVADQVMRMPEPVVRRQAAEEDEPVQVKPLAAQITPLVQRQPATEEEEPMQAKFESGGEAQIQRQTEEEEETAQTVPLQRQPATEKEEEQVQAKTITIQRQCPECEKEIAEEGGTVQRAIDKAQVPVIQRLCPECEEKLQRQAKAEEEERPIQTKLFTPTIQLKRHAWSIQPKSADGQAAPASSHVEANISAMKGGGSPLSHSARNFFEPRFGADFSSVRVHTDSRAAETSKSINARAFTVGSDIAFGPGQYAPETSTGKNLLAHELTHVVQQGRNQQSLLSRKEVAAETMPAEVGMDDTEERNVPGNQEMPGTASAETSPPPNNQGNDVNENVGDGEEEVDIPVFDSNTNEDCPQLVTQESLVPEEVFGGGGEQERAAEGSQAGNDAAFRELLQLVPGPSLLTPFFLPFQFAGAAAFWLWRRLPLQVRAAVVNKAIDLALAGSRFLPGRSSLVTGWLDEWVRAGIIAYLMRLRRFEDRVKVLAFEKYVSVLLGNNVQFTWGFVKGIFQGFFIDGLVGVIQAVIDIICLIANFPKFITSFVRLFRTLPEEMERIFESIIGLYAAVDEAAQNAISEVRALLRQPIRIVAFLNTSFEAGEALSRKMGEKMAEVFMNIWSLPAERLGSIAGRMVGMTIFEILLAWLTSGVGLSVTAAKIMGRLGLKLMALIGKQLLAIARLIGRMLRFLKPFVLNATKYLTKSFRAVGGKLSRLMDAIHDFIEVILRRCRPGSVKCKIPSAKKTGCRGKSVPRLGGFLPHDQYVTRVTGRTNDFRIVLGPVLKCTFDAKVGRTLIEGKTGYGWLASPRIQQRWWFPIAVSRLEAQRVRCLATATRCGFVYVWYMQSKGAAAYLAARWRGVPPVLHRP